MSPQQFLLILGISLSSALAAAESSRFNLASCIRERIPSLDGHETQVVIHNDADVQGLSELPVMQDYEHWGVLTIGTGLGYARFTNRQKASE